MNVVRRLEMRQRALDRELRLTVAVDRALRMGFGNRRLDRLSVCRAGRREHEVLDAGLRHRLEHAQRPDDVVAVVLGRHAHRFADVENRREVHHREDVMAPDGVGDGPRIRDVALDQLAPLHRAAMPGRQVVEYDDAIARARQRLRRVAADVAGAAGDEDGARVSAQWRNK